MSSPDNPVSIEEFVALGHYRARIETALVENPQLADSMPLSQTLQETQRKILALETSAPFIELLIEQRERIDKEVLSLQKGVGLGVVDPEFVERAQRDGLVKEAERIIIFDRAKNKEGESRETGIFEVDASIPHTNGDEDKRIEQSEGVEKPRRKKLTEEFRQEALSAIDDLLETHPVVSKSNILSALDAKGIRLSDAGWIVLRSLFDANGINSFGKGISLRFSKHTVIPRAEEEGEPTEEEIVLTSRMEEFGVADI